MNDSMASTPEEELLASSGNPIDVQALLLSVIRSKWLILSCGVVAAFAAWLLLLRVPPSFRADVEVLPPQITRGGGVGALLSQSGAGDLSALSAFGGSLPGKTQSDTFLTVLSAWPLQDALVKQFDLVHAYNAHNAAEARDILGNNTILKATKEGFIIISIIDRDRKRSAAIANAYVDQTREFLRGMALTEASQRRIFYEGQLAKTKEDLAQAEVAFQKMQQHSGMVSLDSQAKSLLEAAANLRSQITAKQVQLQSLRSYSTESNPQVQIVESELAALQGQLSQVESHGQGGYSGTSLSSVPGAELDFVRATRELKYQEGLYDLMVKQYEGSRIDEARDAPVIQVIEPALVPDRKFGPRRFRDIRLAFSAGLLLGLLLAVLRHFLSRLSPSHRERLTELRRAAIGL